MLGRLQSECGWTPAEAREATLADVDDLFAYWRRHPPLSQLVGVIAQGMRWKPEPEAPAPGDFAAAVADENKMFELPDRWFGQRKG